MLQSEILVVESTEIIEEIEIGDWVVRYTYEGDPDSARYKVGVLVGEINDPVIGFEKETGTPALCVGAVATSTIERNYVDESDILILPEVIRTNTSYHFNKSILLKGLVTDPTEITMSLRGLVDNAVLEENKLNWQATVVGNQMMRYMQRGLFVACGHPELETRIPLNRTSSYPEIRAATLNYMGASVLQTFMSMPFRS